MGEPAVVVGTVTKAHGLRGEVAIHVRSDNPDRFAVGATVLSSAEDRTLTVATVRPHGKGLLVRFAEIADRDGAEALRGTDLWVPEAWLPELPEGEYWPARLEGCAMVTEAGHELGVVTGVIATPAHDLWVARDDAGRETAVPAVRALVVEVDPERKRIVVRDLPGLTAPDDAG